MSFKCVEVKSLHRLMQSALSQCFPTYVLVNVQDMVLSIAEYFIFRQSTVSVQLLIILIPNQLRSRVSWKWEIKRSVWKTKEAVHMFVVCFRCSWSHHSTFYIHMWMLLKQHEVLLDSLTVFTCHHTRELHIAVLRHSSWL